MGSISDKELTQKSGLLQLLTDVPGSSVMADRAFLIDDDLKEIGVGLNIPPFLERKTQFQPNESFEGRKIASLWIHVECCIGRIKNFAILNHIPITLSRLANPTLKVCAWLTNFQPPLILLSPEFMAPAVDSNPSPPYSTDVAGTSSISGTEIPTSTEDCTPDTVSHRWWSCVLIYGTSWLWWYWFQNIFRFWAWSLRLFYNHSCFANTPPKTRMFGWIVSSG